MGVLAHVLEAEGLCTISLAKAKNWAETMKAPRTLQCDFPLGRPLGKPKDPAYQRAVLDSAFAMLGEDEGPVLRFYSESIEDATAEPLSCPLPPRANADDSEAVDEAKGLRAAYNRSVAANGRTNVGRVANADGIVEILRAFERITGGTPWKEASVPGGNILEASKDVMNYYEEAALALADHVPEARAAESWFFQKTKSGQLVKDVRTKLMGDGVPWAMYVAPMTQQ